MIWLPSRWLGLAVRAGGVADRLVDELEGGRERLQIGIACLLRSFPDEAVVDAGHHDELVLHAGELQLLRHFQRLVVQHRGRFSPLSTGCAV